MKVTVLPEAVMARRPEVVGVCLRAMALLVVGRVKRPEVECSLRDHLRVTVLLVERVVAPWRGGRVKTQEVAPSLHKAHAKAMGKLAAALGSLAR
mmetsp:Transcript_46160/g.147418  ORF Transcript_46160/g.147418 Transcript_46160/m.147418 type:complete len:95 (+) Transcript_46160:29-313(+)